MALPFVTERKAEKVVKEVIREGGITGGFSIPTIDLNNEEYHLPKGAEFDLKENPLVLKDNIELPIDLEKCPIINFQYLDPLSREIILIFAIVKIISKRNESESDYHLQTLYNEGTNMSSFVDNWLNNNSIHRISDKYYLNYNEDTFGIKRREITIKTYSITAHKVGEMDDKEIFDTVEFMDDLVYHGDCGVLASSMLSQDGWVWKENADEPISDIKDVLSNATMTWVNSNGEQFRKVCTRVYFEPVYVKPVTGRDLESYDYLLTPDTELSDVNVFYCYRHIHEGGK